LFLAAGSGLRRGKRWQTVACSSLLLARRNDAVREGAVLARAKEGDATHRNEPLRRLKQAEVHGQEQDVA
jgi:hypothetical protein